MRGLLRLGAGGAPAGPASVKPLAPLSPRPQPCSLGRRPGPHSPPAASPPQETPVQSLTPVKRLPLETPVSAIRDSRLRRKRLPSPPQETTVSAARDSRPGTPGCLGNRIFSPISAIAPPCAVLSCAAFRNFVSEPAQEPTPSRSRRRLAEKQRWSDGVVIWRVSSHDFVRPPCRPAGHAPTVPAGRVLAGPPAGSGTPIRVGAGGAGATGTRASFTATAGKQAGVLRRGQAGRSGARPEAQGPGSGDNPFLVECLRLDGQAQGLSKGTPARPG